MELTPRNNPQLIGHADAEQTCLQAWNQNRFPHATLIHGQKGIGKATFAFRLARFILSGGGEGGMFGPSDLSTPEDSPIFARILAGSHGDLMVIESDPESKTGAIKVDQVRGVPQFLAMTASEGAWRVIIVDSVDDLNNNAANALLKVLEEPPAQTALLLVSHQPGRLLPTIRSRCRDLSMHIPNQEDFTRIFALSSITLTPEEEVLLYSLSNGSPGIAMALKDADAPTMYQSLISAIDGAGHLNKNALDQLVKLSVSVKKPELWQSWQLVWEQFIHRLQLHGQQIEFLGKTEQESAVFDRLCERFAFPHWQSVHSHAQQLFADTQALHLDRKQVIHSLLHAAHGDIRIGS